MIKYPADAPSRQFPVRTCRISIKWTRLWRLKSPEPLVFNGCQPSCFFCYLSKQQSNSSQELWRRLLWGHEGSALLLGHGQNRHVFPCRKPQFRSAVDMLCNYIPSHIPCVDQLYAVRSAFRQFQRIPGAASQIIIDQKGLLTAAAHKGELRRKICRRFRFAHAGEAVHKGMPVRRPARECRPVYFGQRTRRRTRGPGSSSRMPRRKAMRDGLSPLSRPPLAHQIISRSGSRKVSPWVQ